MYFYQITAPVEELNAFRYPPQSGKYTLVPSVVGVAETSPATVATHLAARLATLVVPIAVSDACQRVL
jgi:hypothetical protein